jgi:hypothetical protein
MESNLNSEEDEVHWNAYAALEQKKIAANLWSLFPGGSFWAKKSDKEAKDEEAEEKRFV